jgi:hypothetical protein
MAFLRVLRDRVGLPTQSARVPAANSPGEPRAPCRFPARPIDYIMKQLYHDDLEEEMELWMGYEKLDGDREGILNSVERRVSRRSDRRRDQQMSLAETRSDDLGRPERRYERFEPITVRAAARVLQLQRAGVVSAEETRFYLRELAEMDLHARRGAFSSLARIAQRLIATRSLTTGRREAAEGGPSLNLESPDRTAPGLLALA